MARRADTVAGFHRNHMALTIVARLFAGIGWIVSLGGVVACVLTFSAVSVAAGAIYTEGLHADVGTIMSGATPFFSGIILILSGLIVVAFGQVMRVVSTIEANTQAAFLLLDRRLPNPHPDADSYAGLNDHGLGSFPV